MLRSQDAPSTADLVQDDRPGYRPYRVRVAGLRRLSPHFLRVTLTGEDLVWFGTTRLDQRIKLMFPREEDARLCEIGLDDEATLRSGTWYQRWRELPEGERSPIRTYTVRDVRPERAEVDVDMVLHGDAGPASRWALRATPGEELVVVGPDIRSRDHALGADWAPGTATELLLAGDETAAPAICSILETLPAGRNARAFVEVADPADFLDVALPAHASLTWLARGERSHGASLLPAVEEWITTHATTVASARAAQAQDLEDVDVDAEILWDSPVVRVLPHDTCGRGGERCGSDFYAWFAGEASVIRALRRTLVSDAGVCRRRVAFMGYWREGRAEGA